MSACTMGTILLAACGSGARSTASTAPSTVTSTNAPLSRLPKSQIVARTVWPGKAAFAGAERTVAVSGRTVGYRQFGQGPDLVLLEGEEMTMSEWPVSLLADLRAHFRVTMFDWRGVDRSTDDPHSSYSIEAMADDAAAFFDAVGLRAPFVYGLSTGGEVGLALVVRHPDHVARLVVSGATPGGSASVPTSAAVNKIFYDPNASPTTLLGLLFPPGDTRDRDAYLGELLTVPQTLASAATSKRQEAAENAFAAGPGLTAALHAVQTPVLVLNGAHDQLVPPENARRIAAAVPGARLEIFADAGHMLIFQDRARFVTVVEGFLG